MKSKRISGCLYEIRVHPIQSLQSGYSSGLMTKSSSLLSKSSSVCSNGNDSHLPEICKDLIGRALDYLSQNQSDKSSLADSLVSCIGTVCKGVHVVSQTYEQQDEDSTDGIFAINQDAQIQSIQLTSAFQQSVVLTKLWLDSFTESQETDKPGDNLLLNIRKLGGYSQLLLQGCSSDISGMVKEAKAKADHTVEQILQDIGYLAALTVTPLHLPKEECTDTPILQVNMDLVLKNSACSVRTSLNSALRNLKSCLDLLRPTFTSLLKGIDTDISHIHTSLNDIHSSASILNKIYLPWSQHIFGLAEFRNLSETLVCAIQKRDSNRANYARPQDSQHNSAFSPSAIQWV
ncbi:hypothetical protein AB205_0172980 [Aquarana catesbeiana]|uniref:KIF14 four-helical bundle domain-containing protein n=1 Tax=Aquarana catesbeiana TaxID=8400 RepID=A0A2G9RWJ5_AQUCT|nr:hypothetical protein AB205_0172980 [Aquarana catesbeiana]